MKRKILGLMVITVCFLVLGAGCKIEFPAELDSQIVSLASQSEADGQDIQSSAPPSEAPQSSAPDSSDASSDAVPSSAPSAASKGNAASAPSSAPSSLPPSSQKPTSSAAQPSGSGTTKKYCYLSIECKTILQDWEGFQEAKKGLVPKDGILYPKRKVEYTEGQSVFDILLQETKGGGSGKRILMSFRYTPVYDSRYVESIGGIAEFDGREGSGWLYRVNGWFPNYGCSQYKIKDGDVIEWVYTMNGGLDFGYQKEGGQ